MENNVNFTSNLAHHLMDVNQDPTFNIYKEGFWFEKKS